MGIGDNTAAKVIAELGNPAEFASAKALAAYVGLVPATKQSGKSKAHSFGLVRTGHMSLRKALYMPALCAISVNPWLKQYYERLVARGKPKMVAIVAVMRKLLLAIYSVAKNKRPFTPHLLQEGA